MVKKQILITIMALLSLHLSSCGQKIDENALMNNFSKFQKNEEMALVYCHKYVYYKNQVVDLESIPGIKGDFAYGDLIVSGDTIYFSTYEKSNLDEDRKINLYQYNLNTQEVMLSFTRNGYQSAVWSSSKNQYFYFQYLQKVDQYDIFSGEYSTLFDGNESKGKLDELLNKSNFTYKMERGNLIFQHKTSKETYEVNKDVLEKTPEGKMLNQYDWDIYEWFEFDENVYISFIINDENFWNTKYFTIPFIYQLDTKELYFQNIYYLNDYDDSDLYLSL